MHWNHFINTSPSTETIQNVSITIKQWGVKHVYVQLYKHMHCRLGDGLNTASDSPIDRLPESRNASKYRQGHSYETNNKNKVKEVYHYEMKMYICIKTFGNFMWNYFCALHVSVSALQEALS